MMWGGFGSLKFNLYKKSDSWRSKVGVWSISISIRNCVLAGQRLCKVKGRIDFFFSLMIIREHMSK